MLAASSLAPPDGVLTHGGVATDHDGGLGGRQLAPLIRDVSAPLIWGPAPKRGVHTDAVHRPAS